MDELDFRAIKARARSPWPSVRLACARLVAEGLDIGSEEFCGAYVDWLQDASHEATTVDRLAPLLLCRDPIPAQILSELSAAVAYPSLLTDEIGEVIGVSLPPSSGAGIESPPDGFEIAEFFTRNMTGFVPVLFKEAALIFERRYLWSFTRHWAFHWENVMTRGAFSRTTEPLHYLNSGLGRRYLTLESEISEAYLGSFLRTLTELHRMNQAPEQLVRRWALEVFPFAPLLESVAPKPGPPTWASMPIPEDLAKSTLAEERIHVPEIDSWLERLWDRRNKPWMLAAFMTAGQSAASSFEVEVKACLQGDAAGSEDPDLDDLWKSMATVQESAYPLSISASGYCEDAAVFTSGRWSVIPLAAHIHLWAGRRWQNVRRGLGPAGPHSVFRDDDRVELSSGPPLSFERAGATLGVFRDWATDWTDELEDDFPAPMGFALFVRREQVTHLTDTMEMRYAWFYRVSHFVRGEASRGAELFAYTRVIGTSDLVLP